MSVRLKSPKYNCSIGNEHETAVIKKYKAHQGLYDRVSRRLHGVNGYFKAADRDTQIKILRKAYVYSVLTANTPVERADEAYGRWLAGDDIRRATYVTPQQTNDKGRQIHVGLRSFSSAVEPALKQLLDGNVFRAAELIRYSDDLKGLARVKAHFMLALIGANTACLDTHCERFVNRAVDPEIKPSRMGEYFSGVKALDTVDIDVSRFMIQWIAFDMERETVTSHDLFYDSLNIP